VILLLWHFYYLRIVSKDFEIKNRRNPVFFRVPKISLSRKSNVKFGKIEDGVK